MKEQKFESKFHKNYVGGEGVVEEKEYSFLRHSVEFGKMTIDDVLAEYRKYVGDPNAELPQEILEQINLGR